MGRGTPARLQWDPFKLKLRTRNLLSLELEGFTGGIRLEIPFHVLVGKARTPRVLLIAGVHGDEYESVAALQDFVREVNLKSLKGMVIVVPVANPQAFYAGTRRNPVDLGDLNRSFPGKRNGTMSERVADLLFQNLVLGNSAVLSMHCWSKEATIIPYVECSADQNAASRKSFNAAAALGLEFLHPYSWHPGLLVASAIRNGIPSVEPEVGGMGTVTPGGQKTYRSIVYRFLVHFNLLAENDYFTDSPSPTAKVIDHTDCIASYAGFFRSRVAPGDVVKKGDALGSVHDLAGLCLEEVLAPRAGVVGILRTFCSTQPGDRLVQLFWQVPSNPSGKRGASPV